MVKKSGAAGAVYVYRKGARRCTLEAASAHPGDILTVLNADIPVNANEVIEIISIRPGVVVGTEDGQVLS